MQRDNKAISILVVWGEYAYIQLLHLLMYALIFLKARLWSPSVKVLQKPPTAYQMKNESLGSSLQVFHKATTQPPFPMKEVLPDITPPAFFLGVQTSHLLAGILQNFCVKIAPNLRRVCSFFLIIPWISTPISPLAKRVTWGKWLSLTELSLYITNIRIMHIMNMWLQLPLHDRKQRRAERNQGQRLLAPPLIRFGILGNQLALLVLVSSPVKQVQ